MITIGYSTRVSNPEFKKHIRETIGYKNDDVEIIEIVNNGEKSLTECYNIILNQAKNKYVVLCHDDIRLSKTKKWGVKLVNNFKNNPEFNILGVAGTTKLDETGTWWNNKVNLIGQVDHTDGKKTWTSYFSTSLGDNIVESVVLDGVFIAVDKDNLPYKPDESIEGFHFYDVDLTLGNHLNGGKNGVMTNIRVLHKSIGETNDSWEVNRLKFVEKWGDKINQDLEPKILFDKLFIKFKKEPKLAIIIINKSNNFHLFKALTSILKTEYKNFKIYIGDTGSTSDEILEINKFISKYDNISLHDSGEYNFARNNNQMVENVIDKDTEVLLFSNNDIELINDSISIMVNHYLQNKLNVGTIGCRLHYGNNKIQHAGVVLYKTKDQNKLLGFTHIGLNSSYSYGGVCDEVIGNTGAFMLMSKVMFENAGMFNEIYTECFEDVELNLKCILMNKKNYILNNAVGYHYESTTRGLNVDKNGRVNEDYNKHLLPFVLKNYIKIKRNVIEI